MNAKDQKIQDDTASREKRGHRQKTLPAKAALLGYDPGETFS